MLKKCLLSLALILTFCAGIAAIPAYSMDKSSAYTLDHHGGHRGGYGGYGPYGGGCGY